MPIFKGLKTLTDAIPAEASKDNLRKLIFSLPGNPLAVLINLIFLVSFFINPESNKIISLSQKIKSGFNDTKKSNITKFYRVNIKNNKALPQNTKGSAKLISASESDGLMLIKENIKSIKKGDIYDFFKFEI